MRDYALKSGRDPGAVIAVHSTCPLPTGSRGGLGVEITLRLLGVRVISGGRRLLYHRDWLARVSCSGSRSSCRGRLGWVRGRGALVGIRAVHVTVHSSLLRLLLLLLRSTRVRRIHMHAISSLLGLYSLLLLRLLCLLRALFRQSFSLLLLLHTRCGRSIASFEVHLRLERSAEFLLRDKRMCAGLLWGPAFEGVDVEEAVDEVYEGFSIGHFYTLSAHHSPLILHD